jgi:hypothetical protein
MSGGSWCMGNTETAKGADHEKILLVLLLCLPAALISCAGENKQESVIESGAAGPGDQGYTYKIIDEKMQFDWRINGASLLVKLKADTPGWLGIGFNPTVGMKDATFVIGFVKNGQVTITQQHGTDLKQHLKDSDLGGSDNMAAAAGRQTIKRKSASRFRCTHPTSLTARLTRRLTPWCCSPTA